MAVLPPLSLDLRDSRCNGADPTCSLLLRWGCPFKERPAFQRRRSRRSCGLSVSGAVAPSAPASSAGLSRTGALCRTGLPIQRRKLVRRALESIGGRGFKLVKRGKPKMRRHLSSSGRVAVRGTHACNDTASLHLSGVDGPDKPGHDTLGAQLKKADARGSAYICSGVSRPISDRPSSSCFSVSAARPRRERRTASSFSGRIGQAA